MVGILYHKQVRGGGKKQKTSRQLESVFKGLANYHRMEILLLLEKEEGLSVEQISQKLSYGYMNTSDHIRKLSLGGLVSKHKEALIVRHLLTARAKSILEFCKILE